MKLLEVEGVRVSVPHSWRRHCPSNWYMKLSSLCLKRCTVTCETQKKQKVLQTFHCFILPVATSKTETNKCFPLKVLQLLQNFLDRGYM